MYKVVILYLLLFFFSQTLLAQDVQVKSAAFINIDKIDSLINLQELDYELINKGVLYYTNKHRDSKHKSKLNYNKELEVSALIHSLEMKKHNFFSHTNKKNKKMRNLDDRVKFSGYTNYKLLSENLYNGFIDLDKKPTYKEISYTIFKAFKVSKSHNENLLNADLKEIGSSLVFKTKIEDGFLYYYFTQNFGTKH